MTANTLIPVSTARRLAVVGISLFVAVTAMGCAGRYRARVTTTPVQATVQTGVIYQAPPAPRAAYVPPQPYANAQWVEGHWEWNGGQYVWVDGYWVEARQGYVYVQPRWERRGTGYVYVDGGWGHHHGGAVVVQQPRPATVVAAPRASGTVVVQQPSRPVGGAVVVQQPSRPVGGTVVVQPARPAGGSVVVQPAQPRGGSVTVQAPAPPSASVTVTGGGRRGRASGRVVVTPR